jgi:hypothetical protein
VVDGEVMDNEDDLQAALKLLDGWQVWDAHGLARHREYLKDEWESRKAIYRLLMSPKPLNRQLRLQLAVLFVAEREQRPDSPLRADIVERRIKFEHLRPGHRDESYRALQIAYAVLEHMIDQERAGKTPNQKIARGHVAEKYGVTDRTVRAAIAAGAGMFRRAGMSKSK